MAAIRTSAGLTVGWGGAIRPGTHMQTIDGQTVLKTVNVIRTGVVPVCAVWVYSVTDINKLHMVKRWHTNIILKYNYFND